jgi:hypothetical protein
MVTEHFREWLEEYFLQPLIEDLRQKGWMQRQKYHLPHIFCRVSWT